MAYATEMPKKQQGYIMSDIRIKTIVLAIEFIFGYTTRPLKAIYLDYDTEKKFMMKNK